MKFFIGVLAANLIFETLAGVVLITGDLGLNAEVMAPEGMWGMNYGFAALAIASALIWIWPHRTSFAATGVILGVLITFHAGLFIALMLAGNQLTPAILHLTLGVLCLVAWLRRATWCSS